MHIAEGSDKAKQQSQQLGMKTNPYQSSSSSEQTYDAIVIGAGFAGLTAARILSTFGLRPLVIEARERIGGRAYTGEFPAAPDLGLPDSSPVEEGCNYLHGCDEDQPLFLLARALQVPTAVCPGDLGGQYSGWESVETAEWHDASRGGELIPLEEVVSAVLLLEQAVCGVGVLMPTQPLPQASSREPSVGPEAEAGGAALGGALGPPGAPTERGRGPEGGGHGLGSTATLEEALERSLAAVLERRLQAGRRMEARVTAREAAMLRSIRGRHLGYVAACHRMPARTLASEVAGAYRKHVFEDGHWPHSAENLVPGLLALLRRKQALAAEAPPQAEVAEHVEDAGEDRLVLGPGFRAFIDFLAEGLETHLGEAVRDVEQSSGDVTVRLRSGRTFSAPLVVLTAPVGVLAGLCAEESGLRFTPPLPEDKLAAARRLAPPFRGAPTHEKVVMRWHLAAPFVTCILDAAHAPLQIETTDHRFHFLNLHKYGRNGQLLCHIWGDADWSEHATLSDEQIVAEVVAALRAMYPQAPAHLAVPADEHFVTKPIQWKVTRWSMDPFALGAYSELQSPEASEADHTILARPEGRIFFAGEACVPSMAGAQCTHGALLSGARAALGVLACLGHQGVAATKLLDDSGPLGLDVGAVVSALVGHVDAPPEEKRLKRRRSATAISEFLCSFEADDNVGGIAP